MTYFTSNTYTLKRKILTFTNKISKCLSKPEKKFVANMTYGMLAANSCLLTDVAEQLHESTKKINTVDRLSRHLEKGTPTKASDSYLHFIKNGFRQSQSYTLITAMLLSRKVISLNHSVLFGTVLQVLLQKMFIKKVIMLQKPVFLLPAIIRLAYFHVFILPPKKVTNQLMS